MSPPSEDDPRLRALAKLDAVPDLLALATEKQRTNVAGFEDLHAGQRTLAAEFRRDGRPFMVTEVFRSLETCRSGEHRFPRRVYRIEMHQPNPLVRLLRPTAVLVLPETRLHDIRVHGADFSAEELAFLERL